MPVQFRQIVRPAAAILAAAGLALAALAEPPAKPDVLSGPPVKETRVPGERGSFGGTSGGLKKAGAREIPHVAFMRSVNAAVGEGAPAELRLSPQQQTEISAINDEFTKAQREYYGKNKAELDKIRPSALRETRTDGKKATKDDKNAAKNPAMEDGAEMTPTEREALAEKARTLRENAPQPGDAHKKIWAVLNEKQQAAAQVKLDEFKARMKAEEDARYVEREKKKLELQNKGAADATDTKKNAERLRKRAEAAGEEAKKDGAAAPVQRPNAAGAKRPLNGGPAGGGDAERRERLLRLFEKLSPEQRDQLLQRLEGIAGGGGPASRDGAKRPGKQVGDEAKPAPSMDGVAVPKAE